MKTSDTGGLRIAGNAMILRVPPTNKVDPSGPFDLAQDTPWFGPAARYSFLPWHWSKVGNAGGRGRATKKQGLNGTKKVLVGSGGAADNGSLVSKDIRRRFLERRSTGMPRLRGGKRGP